MVTETDQEQRRYRTEQSYYWVLMSWHDICMIYACQCIHVTLWHDISMHVTLLQIYVYI